MTKKKTNLRKYNRRRDKTNAEQTNEQLLRPTQKRPLKMKSPMKSPYRYLKSESPAVKRFKPKSPFKSPCNRHLTKSPYAKRLTPIWKSPSLKHRPSATSPSARKVRSARMLFKQATLEPAQNTAQTCSKLKIAGIETMLSADKCDTISSDTVSADEFSRICLLTQRPFMN